MDQIYDEQIGVPLDEFLEQNNNLIHSVARRHISKLKGVEEYDDLYQLASIGLVKAYNDYNPALFNTTFSTYAVPKMNGEIQRYYRDNYTSVKFPRIFHEIWSKVRRYDISNEPAEIIAEKIDVEPRLVKKAMQYFNKHQAFSIEEKFFSNGFKDSDLKIKDTLGADQDYTELYVNEFMENLPEQLKTVLSLKLNDDLTQRDIGKIMGISQVHVSRLLKKIESHLLEYLELAG